MPWANAQTAAARLASGKCGLSDGSKPGDWRLPSLNELVGLIDFRFLPALSNTWGGGPWRPGDPFINVDLNGLYWSSSPLALEPAPGQKLPISWNISFSNGNLFDDVQEVPYYFWPVKGPEAAPPQPRFTSNGDGTVTDNSTGLVWLQNANAFALQTWSTAVQIAAELADGAQGLSDGSRPGDWRLPGIKELLSVMDYSVASPSVSNTAGTGPCPQSPPADPPDPFANIMQTNLYWSATSAQDNDHNAWVVLLSAGNMSTTLKIGYYYVWPVRAGQPPTRG